MLQDSFKTLAFMKNCMARILQSIDFIDVHLAIISSTGDSPESKRRDDVKDVIAVPNTVKNDRRFRQLSSTEKWCLLPFLVNSTGKRQRQYRCLKMVFSMGFGIENRYFGTENRFLIPINGMQNMNIFFEFFLYSIMSTHFQ